jgi:hypothetical protein
VKEQRRGYPVFYPNTPLSVLYLTILSERNPPPLFRAAGSILYRDNIYLYGNHSGGAF